MQDSTTYHFWRCACALVWRILHWTHDGCGASWQ